MSDLDLYKMPKVPGMPVLNEGPMLPDWFSPAPVPEGFVRGNVWDQLPEAPPAYQPQYQMPDNTPLDQVAFDRMVNDLSTLRSNYVKPPEDWPASAQAFHPNYQEWKPTSDGVFTMGADGEIAVEHPEEFANRYGIKLPTGADVLRSMPKYMLGHAASGIGAAGDWLFDESVALPTAGGEAKPIQGVSTVLNNVFRDLEKAGHEYAFNALPENWEYLESWEKGAISGFGSAGTMLPSLLAGGGAGVLSRAVAGATAKGALNFATNLSLGIMGTTAAGLGETQFEAYGYSKPVAKALGGIVGVIEAFSEKTPVGAFMDMWGPGWKTALAKYILTEAGQEVLVAEPLQAVMDKLTIDPDMTWDDFYKREGDLLESLPWALGGTAAAGKAFQVATDAPYYKDKAIRAALDATAVTPENKSRAIGYEMAQQLKGIEPALTVEDQVAVGRDMNMLPWQISPDDEISTRAGRSGPPVPPGIARGFAETVASFDMEAPGDDLYRYTGSEQGLMKDAFAAMDAVMPVMPALERMKSADPLMANVAAVKVTGKPLQAEQDVLEAMDYSAAQMSRPVNPPNTVYLGDHEMLSLVRPGGPGIGYSVDLQHVMDRESTTIAKFPTELAARTYMNLIGKRYEDMEANLPSYRVALGKVSTYPMASRSEWYGNADYEQRGGEIVEMSPDSFLSIAKPLEIDEASRDNIDDLKRHIQSGRTLDPLSYYGGKTVRGTDGRHRAVAAKELGIKTVPVINLSGSQIDMPADTVESFNVDWSRLVRDIEETEYSIKAAPDVVQRVYPTPPPMAVVSRMGAIELDDRMLELVNKVAADLVESGYPQELVNQLSFIAIPDTAYNGSTTGAMTIWPTINTVGIREAYFEAVFETGDAAIERSFVQSLAHEMSHYLDMGNTVDAWSATSPMFSVDLNAFEYDIDQGKIYIGDETNIGEIYIELFDAMSDPTVTKYFSYPMDAFPRMILDNDVGRIPWLNAEVFAQIGALYLTHEPFLKRVMPVAHRMMENIYENNIRITNGAADSPLQQAVQGGSPYGGLKDLPGFAIEAGAGPGQREAGPGGRAGTPGRATYVETHRRIKTGSNKGNYVGAPALYNTPAKIPSLRALLRRLVTDGFPFKDWYRESAQAALRAAGGDMVEAEKIIQLLAIFSPSNKVGGNTTAAIKAYFQWRRGEKITAGRYGAHADNANALMYGGKDWEGRKTNSFYINLMTELDPTILDRLYVREDGTPILIGEKESPKVGWLPAKSPVTVDMWIARIFGYPTDSVSTAQYHFAEEEIRRTASEFGITPHEAQAAMWVAFNGLWQQTDGGKPADVKARMKARKTAVGAELTDKWRNAGGVSFATYMNYATEVSTWETLPSVDTPIGKALSALTFDQKTAYTREALGLIYDGATDLLAEEIGMPFRWTFPSVGAYADMGETDSTLHPNVLTGAVADMDTSGKKTTYDEKLIDLYSLAIQYIYSQDAVPWFRPDNRATGAWAHKGVALEFENKITGEDLDYLLFTLRTLVHPQVGFTVTDENQVVVINFRDMIDGKVKPWMMPDADFYASLDRVTSAHGEALGLVDAHELRAPGNYHGKWNDGKDGWDSDPEGSKLEDQIREAGGQDLLPWLRDRRDRAQQLGAEHAQKGQVDLPSFDIQGPVEVAGTDLEPFLARLSTEEDAKALLAKVVADNESEMLAARRGKMTVEEIQQRAAQLGWSEADMKKIPRGSGVSPEEFEAGRAIMTKALDRLKTLADKARHGKDEDLLAYEHALQQFKPLAETMLGMRAEWGRVGVMMQQMGADMRMMASIMDEMGGGTTIQAKAAAVADLVDRGASDAEVAAAANKLAETRRIDQILEFWYASLLSGLRTHAVNSASNALVALWTLPEQLTAAMLGKLHSGDKVYLQDVLARGVGMINGIQDGALLANEIMREEMPMGQFIAGNLSKVLGVSDYITDNKESLEAQLGQKREGQPRLKHIPGKIGDVIRSPLTMLSVEDAFFQMVGQRMELYALAARQAINEGAPNINDRAAAIRAGVDALIGTARPKVKDMTAEEQMLWRIFDQAWEAGKYQTFTNDLGPMGRGATTFLNRHPIPFRFTVPFLRTPTNIVKFFGHRTPLALAMPSFWVMFNKGGAHRDIAIARILFGSAVMAMTITLALAGKITGGGPDPTQRNERQIWRQKYQPYSAKYGDNYYGFNRLEPLGMLVGVAADIAYLWDRATEAEKGEIYRLVLASISRNLLSKTWLTGVSDAVKFFDDPYRYGNNFIGRFISSFVPTIVSHVAQVTDDPYMREARTLLDQVRSRVPGLRDNLEVRHNVWGEPITYGGILGPDLISFVYMGADPKDPVVDEMLRLEYFPGMPNRKLRGVELSSEQYNLYVRLRGIPAKKVLDKLIALPEWGMMSDWRKVERIKDTFRTATDAAGDEMSRRYAEIPSEKDVDDARKYERSRQDIESIRQWQEM